MSAVPRPEGPSIHAVTRAVAQELGCTVRDIRRPTRGRPEHSWARAVAMWVYQATHSHAVTGGRACSWAEVGRVFDRDRTTARHAIMRVNAALQTNLAFDAILGRILEAL